MRALAAGVMVAVLGCVSVVHGQDPGKQTVAEQRTAEALAALHKAISDSSAANKVLLVTFGSDPGRVKLNEQMLAVPATAGWVARHGMTHAVNDQRLITELGTVKFSSPDKEDPTKRNVLGYGLTQVAGGDPLFFSDGTIDLLDKRSSIVATSAPKADPKTTAGQGSLALAMRLDWTLRSPSASEDFRKRHATTLTKVAWPGSAQGKSPALLPQLNAARELAKDKKWDEAANAYANAWWDTAGSVTATPIRVGSMAAEMALVAKLSPGAKDRLLGLRTEYARAMDVSDLRHVHEYLILCRIVDDHEHNLKFLDESTQTKSASAQLPAADLMAIEWMLPRCHWNDPNEGVSKPGAWCAQVVRQCDKLAARKDAQAWTGAIDYGRWLAREEAARRLSWLLAAGREDQATQLRDTVIAADASPEMKRALVAASLASGQKRAWMSELLKGIEDDELANELKK